MFDEDSADDIHPLFFGAPKSTEFRKLRKRLVQNVREAIETYGMVTPGDRWLICLSGGKDSYTLLAVLTELKWRGLLPVDLLACNLDQGQPGFPATVLPEFLTRMGVPHRIEYQDTYSVVVDKIKPGGTMCSLCSRLRRGNLYRIAREALRRNPGLKEKAERPFLRRAAHGVGQRRRKRDIHEKRPEPHRKQQRGLVLLHDRKVDESHPDEKHRSLLYGQRGDGLDKKVHVCSLPFGVCPDMWPGNGKEPSGRLRRPEGSKIAAFRPFRSISFSKGTTAPEATGRAARTTRPSSPPMRRRSGRSTGRASR